MSSSSSKTLIRSAASAYAYLSSSGPRAIRRLSTLPESSLCVEPTGAGAEVESDSDAKAMAVEKIEDIIHSFIFMRSKPDWIPFLPGTSYWVPPRRTLYGVAGMVENIANSLTEEEYLSLTTFQGWPSSAFYIHNGK